MEHKHLSQEERYYIEISLKKGDSQNAIAKALNRSQGIYYPKKTKQFFPKFNSQKSKIKQ